MTQSKTSKFMPTMHQNVFGSQALPKHVGGAFLLHRPPSYNKGPTSKGERREGREGGNDVWEEKTKREGKGKGRLMRVCRSI